MSNTWPLTTKPHYIHMFNGYIKATSDFGYISLTL